MTTWWRLSCAGRTLDSIPGLCPLEASSTPPVVRADPVPGGATHSSTPLRIPVLTSVPCHLVFHFPSLPYNSSEPQGEGCCIPDQRDARDCPGGPVVKRPPANAGVTGSIPGPGTKIPHRGAATPWAPSLRSPCSRATTTDAHVPHQSPHSAAREAPAMRSPRTSTRE